MSEAIGIEGRNDPSRPPTPGTVVPCPLKGGAQIAVGRCVEWQAENDCCCEHALVALGRTRKLLRGAGARVGRSDGVSSAKNLADEERDLRQRLAQIDELTTRAEQIEAARPAVHSMEQEPASPPAEEETMPRQSKLDAITDDELRDRYLKAGSVTALRAAIGCGMKLLQDRLAAIGASAARAPVSADAEPDKPRAQQSLVAQHPYSARIGVHQVVPPVPDEFEAMREVLDGFLSLSLAGRQYVLGRINDELKAP